MTAMRSATRVVVAACIAIPALVVGLLARQSWQAESNLLRERRRHGRRLIESEERYRSLFTSIDEGFCIVEVKFDERGRATDYLFLEVNPSFEKQTGLSGAQGKWMRELAPQHEEHWFEVYGKVALTGEPTRFVNRAEQLQRWYDVYAFRHGRPELHQVAILFNDITDRLVAEREASEEARRKDQFLALLAHELRNPLAPIRYAVQALGVAGPNSDKAMLELLPMIERQVAHMARLLDDLLDVSRITRGAVELRKERTDLRSAVQIGIEANRPLIERLGHELTVSMPSDPLWLDGDPARLVQIVSNLLNNAATYSPAGSSIDIKAERDGKWICARQSLIQIQHARPAPL